MNAYEASRLRLAQRIANALGDDETGDWSLVAIVVGAYAFYVAAALWSVA